MSTLIGRRSKSRLLRARGHFITPVICASKQYPTCVIRVYNCDTQALTSRQVFQNLSPQDCELIAQQLTNCRVTWNFFNPQAGIAAAGDFDFCPPPPPQYPTMIGYSEETPFLTGSYTWNNSFINGKPVYQNASGSYIFFGTENGGRWVAQTTQGASSIKIRNGFQTEDYPPQFKWQTFAGTQGLFFLEHVGFPAWKINVENAGGTYLNGTYKMTNSWTSGAPIWTNEADGSLAMYHRALSADWIIIRQNPLNYYRGWPGSANAYPDCASFQPWAAPAPAPTLNFLFDPEA